MSALTDALKHPENRPAPLVRWLASQVAPSADLSGLSDGGGVFCDLRQGMEEKDPSTSVSVGRNGGAVFRRHGADDAGLSAVQYIAAVLNVSKGEAARLLIERAGITEEKRPQKKQGGKRKAPRGPQNAQQGTAKKEDGQDPQQPTPKPLNVPDALEKLATFGPLEAQDLAYRLRGLSPLLADDGSEAGQEITRRGLWPAVLCGVLRAYTLEEGAALPAHSLEGALFFEVTGPDGQAWAVKFRNTDAALDNAEAQTGKRPTRYAYVVTRHKSGRPAWCAGPMREDLPTLLIEGELNAVAVWAMLHAVGMAERFNIQGVASAGALPHVSHLKEGAKVYIFADMGDKRGEGDTARRNWGKLAHSFGARVFQLGHRDNGEANPFAYTDALEKMVLDADACDALGSFSPLSSPEQTARFFGGKLLEAIEQARMWTPAPTLEEARASIVWASETEGFTEDGGKLCAVKKRFNQGEEWEETEELLNFSAYITAEITQDDGTGEGSKVFEIMGQRSDGRPMNPQRLYIPSSEFMGMGWPAAKWGASAIVRSGNGKKDKAREGIQRLSAARGITERTVYQFTGWKHTDAGAVYLHAGGGLGAFGAVTGLEVDLTGGNGRLNAYELPDPTGHGEEEKREAVRASLALLDLVGLDPVGVPVLGAAYRAVLGRANFALWLTGETGRNKTALLALIQAHYGRRWTAEHLPDGWNSSANALEKAAFTVKDALFLIDDFKPSGAQADVSKMHGAAARILAAAADGAGRGTLTVNRQSRAGLYPRGLLISSGETLPRGHSNRARAVIVDVTRPLIGKDAAKSEAFYDAADKAGEGVYVLALASFVQAIAGNYDALKVGGETHKAHVRQWAKVFTGAHGRTGPALAELSYGWACFLSFAVSLEAITEAHAVTLWGRVVSALAYTSEGQAEHLHSEDPVTRALSLTASLLAQGRVYLEDLKTGGPPADPQVGLMCGWQLHRYGEEEKLTVRPNAVKVGYYSKAGGDEWAHFDPEALHEQLQRSASGQGGASLPDKGTLWANMRDRLHPAGLMRCTTEGQKVRTGLKTSTPDGLRPYLLTLRLPFSLGAYEFGGTSGTGGTDSEEKTYDTGFLPVPLSLFFKKVYGTSGTDKTVFSSSPLDLFPAGLPDDGEALQDWGEV